MSQDVMKFVFYIVLGMALGGGAIQSVMSAKVGLRGKRPLFDRAISPTVFWIWALVATAASAWCLWQAFQAWFKL
jgi:hypothetical protein